MESHFMPTVRQDPSSRGAPAAADRLDVVVVGAGFAGLYALHHLRARGFRTLVLEAGTGVGGTWFWNRYPGARCDVPSLEYSYSFSKELQEEWEWTELMPPQAEVEAYLNHVADRFDLRRDIRLGTTVTAATFDEAQGCWRIDTAAGERFDAPFCVMATGCLSAPVVPDLPGRDRFEGRILQTSRWPQERVEFAGQRVGLVGTGSSGVQSTPVIAAEASHLYVFQRTATFTMPALNRPLDAETQRSVKDNYEELRRKQRDSPLGLVMFGGALLPTEPPSRKILDTPIEERMQLLDEIGWWAPRAFGDVMTDLDANAAAVEMYCEMVRRTVTDPDVADALSPKGYPMGCKRMVVDMGYFPTFNRDNVTLVDLRREGIEAITATGIQTGQRHIDLDMIVFATGFDAMTGALNRIDIRGRGGRTLRDAWADGPRTYLGLQSVGFPNLFTVTGPGSPSVLTNMVVSIEQHVEWLGDCLDHLRAHDVATIEPTPAAQDDWVAHVNQVGQGTMYTAPSCNSWYLGANVPGKPRMFLPYVGGLVAYRKKCDEVAAAGYEGFTLSSHPTPG
jgi:cyclohexanone monooxygenase